MPNIYLKQTRTYQTLTRSQSVTVTVSCEAYPTSNLFTRYKHAPTSENNWTPGEQIKISNNKGMPGLTLKPNGEYAKKELNNAYVYFNKFDVANKKPLLLSLHFKNDIPEVKGFYFQYMEIEAFFSYRHPLDISYMSDFQDDKELFSILISENYYNNYSLIYMINKTNNESRDSAYSSRSISISKQENVDNGQPNGFHKYTHKPNYGAMKSYVLYNKNVLANKDKQPIEEIQGKEYKEITVYFGTRAKTSGRGRNQRDIPLLIELTKKDPPSDPDYYVHKRNPSGVYYWINILEVGGMELEGLLVDMGFGFKNGDNGYKELQGLLSTAGVRVSDGDDLSEKLTQVKGDKLQSLLSQTVGDGGVGGSPKSFLQLLLTQIEFDLLDSVVILLDKTDTSGSTTYDESDVVGPVAGLVPPKEINTIDMNGGSKNISVSNATTSNGKCVKPYGYKLIKHDITKVVQDLGQPDQPSEAGIRFIIPSEKGSDQYHQLKLYDKDKPEPQNLQYTYYEQSKNEVYVYYYDGDPRPLLVCYNGCAYKPRKKLDPIQSMQVIVEYTEWVKIEGITQCTCQNGGTIGSPNEQILDALNDVVGYLNPVQINPNQIPDPAKGAITGESQEQPLKAEYDLHKYIKGTTVIKMGITRDKVGCYDKYTYQPYGLNGQSSGQRAEGYRLGNVIHTKTGYGTQRSPLNYTKLDTSYKYHPLVGVTVYYYDADKQYDDPLLIELEFKNGGVSNEKEYYKLDKAGDSSGGTLEWKLDNEAQGKMGSNPVEHLDSIRHSLKPVVKILIDKQSQYKLCLSNEKGGTSNTYNPANGGDKQIEVKACDDSNGCSKLSDHGYKCYQHKVSEINSGGFDYNTIGGLKFYISGKNGVASNDIEIKLHKDSSGGGEITELLYNTCMKDIYVFFYCKNGGDQDCPSASSKPPSAPLMLLYNKNYYKPVDIDKYFEKWVPETGLTSVTAPCGADTNYTQLANKLNEVNRALNRICLTHQMGGGSTSEYGISKPQSPTSTTPNIELDRIKVTKIPGNPTQTRPYCKLVHRTINDFTIGEIYYNSKDITQGGVSINGGSISVESTGSKNHTNFVNGAGSNTPNTVVAYYHSEDSTYKLPQLIVLLHTQEEIRESATITATSNTKYGYYVLGTNGNDGGGNTYKYEWRQPNETLTLNDETEFKLLNSLVILVDQQNEYNEGAIQTALAKSDSIRSPGNGDGVNRLQNRNIDVKNETETTKGKCVSTYGYKLFEHDLTAVTATIHGIKPILGLRFLIPSKSSASEYKQITLYKEETIQPQNIEYMYFDGTNKTLYVYFYGEDPRPLLLCYFKSAYIPKKQNESAQDKPVDVAYKKWTKVKQISKCVCENGRTDIKNDNILNTLLDVVLFLNPVQLNPNQIPRRASTTITASPGSIEYNLHKFTATQTVQMKITRDDVKCYEKYTYEPAGTTGTSGDGFRLGNVIYHETGTDTFKGNINYPNDIAFLYDPLVKVTVYYYDHDKQYEDPLLIQLDFTKIIGSGTQINLTEYYKLTKNDGISNVDWKLDPDAQTQIGTGEQEKLITYLDTIRYQFKKVVMIKIDQNRPGSYDLKARPGSGSAGSGFGPIGSGKQIQVVECDDSVCTKLKETNYTCFKHTLTDLQDQDHHQIGGVVMTLPSNKGDDQAVEIPIFDSNDQQKQLYYNSCMNDLIVHVYFYFITRTSQVDNVPLMLCYNSNYYKPIDRDDYLHLWHHEPSLNSAEPCKKDDMIKAHLDLINTELNRIDLTHQITSGSTSEYGIPSTQARPEIDSAFDLNRIQVTTIPAQAKETRPYCKLVHRTVNDFRIGEIWYDQDIIKNSVIIKNNGVSNGNTIISVNRLKNHNSFIITNKTTNTVVVYYSDSDKTHKLPQLMLLMTTEKPIETSTDPVTATTETSYGYYIINHSDGDCSDLKYEWREPDDTGTPLKLDEKTELSLLNSVVILVEQKPNSESGSSSTSTYGDDKIDAAVKKAIESKSLQKSPGLKNDDINRLKGKDITPTDVTTQAQGLDQTGFIAIKHDMTEIVDPKIDGAQDITLIAILRFFIPTPKGDGEYTVLNLYDYTSSSNPLIIYHQKTQNSVCVYFYKEDPRPLLLCYNKQAYRASNIYYYDLQEWHKASKVENCSCDKTVKNLLVAIVRVSNFLNPVKIERTINGQYVVHKFNGQEICIKLDVTKSNGKFCYHKYTHKHNGMRKSGQNVRASEATSVEAGKGFRLGSITYLNKSLEIVEQPPNSENKPVKLISSLINEKPNYDSASEVVVYYYKGDPNHQNPLLVVLKNSLGTYKPYYELQRSTTTTTTYKRYKKESTPLDLDPTKGGQLETILDKLLSKGNKILQVNLGFMTKIEFKYPGERGKQVPTMIHNTYSATVYENQSTKLRKTTEKIQVEVSEAIEVKTTSGNVTGYQCYQHKLLNIDNINEFNGLRLFLWDNRTSEDNDSQCKITKPNPLTKHKCCELDLYEDTSPVQPIAYTACKGDLYVYFYARGKYWYYNRPNIIQAF